MLYYEEKERNEQWISPSLMNNLNNINEIRSFVNIKMPLCQAKVEMSYSYQNRNVLF